MLPLKKFVQCRPSHEPRRPLTADPLDTAYVIGLMHAPEARLSSDGVAAQLEGFGYTKLVKKRCYAAYLDGVEYQANRLIEMGLYDPPVFLKHRKVS